MRGVAARSETCRLLDLDPDIGRGIDPADWERARSMCVATVHHLPAGRWELPAYGTDSIHLLGFLIADGMLCREVALRDHHMVELLGPGEVVQPPAPAAHSRLGGPVQVTVAVETMAIALGEPFVRAAARWPSLLTAVHERLEAQRENLAIQGLITHVARAEHRVLLQLWHLADRWGRVTAEGTVVPLSLTHQLLGTLIAARRSTVTLAVSALELQGLIRRLPDQEWLLTPAAELAIATLTGPGARDHPLGEAFRSRKRAVALAGESRALRAESKQLKSAGVPARANRKY